MTAGSNSQEIHVQTMVELNLAGGRKLTVYDNLSLKSAHDKLKIQIEGPDVDIHHFLTASNFAVFLNSLLDIGCFEPEEVSYREQKGSPNSQGGYTAREARFVLKEGTNPTIAVTLVTGEGQYQNDNHVTLITPSKTTYIEVPLLDFQGLAIKVLQYMQSKTTVMMLKGESVPKPGPRRR